MKLISFSTLLAIATILGAAEDQPGVKQDETTVRRLVEQLASRDFATRERAMKELSQLDTVPEVLNKATKSSDPEVRRRAQTAIDVITTRAEEKAHKTLIQWMQVDDFASNTPHDPLVIRDNVIVGTDQGQLRAYRCEDGRSVWVHQHGVRIYHRLSSDGERIYFTSAKGLKAVKVADGSEVWSFGHTSCDGPTCVLAKKGMVVVGGPDGILYAVESKTGKVLWESDFLADAPPDPINFPGERARLENTRARPSALSSDGETLYLSVFDQSRVVAFNADNGKRRWSFQTGGWIYGAAVANDKHVFLGSQDMNFYCLDKQTGKKVWSFQTKGRTERGGALDEKYVYFGSTDGSVYCLHQDNGKLRWQFDTDPPEGRTRAIYSVPLLRQGSVYFGAGEGQVYAVHKETGKLKWKVRPSKGSELFSTPATDEGLLFLVSRARSQGVGVPSLVAIRMK